VIRGESDRDEGHHIAGVGASKGLDTRALVAGSHFARIVLVYMFGSITDTHMGRRSDLRPSACEHWINIVEECITPTAQIIILHGMQLPA